MPLFEGNDDGKRAKITKVNCSHSGMSVCPPVYSLILYRNFKGREKDLAKNCKTQRENLESRIYTLRFLANSELKS